MRSLILNSFLLIGSSLWPANAGTNYLTAKNIQQIKKFWPAYTYAAEKTGVPVFLLPAIHYRESDLNTGWYSKKEKRPIRNIGGPFMLDRGGKEKDFKKNIRKYEAEVFRLYGGKGWVIPEVADSFKFACLVAAHELKVKNRRTGWSFKNTTETVWRYNGKTRPSCVGNCYLWNDPKRGVFLLSRHKNIHGKNVHYLDERPGVMIIYKELLNRP